MTATTDASTAFGHRHLFAVAAPWPVMQRENWTKTKRPTFLLSFHRPQRAQEHLLRHHTRAVWGSRSSSSRRRRIGRVISNQLVEDPTSSIKFALRHRRRLTWDVVIRYSWATEKPNSAFHWMAEQDPALRIKSALRHRRRLLRTTRTVLRRRTLHRFKVWNPVMTISNKSQQATISNKSPQAMSLL